MNGTAPRIGDRYDDTDDSADGRQLLIVGLVAGYDGRMFTAEVVRAPGAPTTVGKLLEVSAAELGRGYRWVDGRPPVAADHEDDALPPDPPFATNSVVELGATPSVGGVYEDGYWMAGLRQVLVHDVSTDVAGDLIVQFEVIVAPSHASPQDIGHMETCCVLIFGERYTRLNEPALTQPPVPAETPPVTVRPVVTLPQAARPGLFDVGVTLDRVRAVLAVGYDDDEPAQQAQLDKIVALLDWQLALRASPAH